MKKTLLLSVLLTTVFSPMLAQTTDTTLFENHISIENAQEITIFNILGAVVYKNSTTSAKNQIDLSALPSGLYFVKANGNQVVKIIKQQ